MVYMVEAAQQSVSTHTHKVNKISSPKMSATKKEKKEDYYALEK